LIRPRKSPPDAFKLREEWADEGAFDLADRVVLPKAEAEGPAQARLRFIGIDAQRDGYYAVCRSYAKDGRSRLYDWAFFNTPEEVEAFRVRCGVIPPFTFIDCGDQMDQVHRIAARLRLELHPRDTQNRIPLDDQGPGR